MIKNLLTSASLGTYMQYIANSRTPFTPHSLRIGGHILLDTKHAWRFCAVLGRRSICRASQLYYRANAADNICRLRLFFRKISLRLILTTGLYGVTRQKIYTLTVIDKNHVAAGGFEFFGVFLLWV